MDISDLAPKKRKDDAGTAGPSKPTSKKTASRPKCCSVTAPSLSYLEEGTSSGEMAAKLEASIPDPTVDRDAAEGTVAGDASSVPLTKTAAEGVDEGVSADP
ncbi:hypothetical protein GUJ93_ZPchr0004g39690 [Zizania palustris]|uniref:Uncharacterized protein n=1 Tax=Zizania palustris TaxID=103762 RepID=A0A8J5SJ47_ZIZPA|nr:hypothetical protein GUJ93_ZPchr0004g39690 [Zizania palustris]